MIIKISIPIMNYDMNGVFFQEFYFESEFSPSQQEVINKLVELDEEYKDAPDYGNGLKECIDIVKSVKDWKMVYKNGIVHTNTFVEHPQLGKQPFSWEIIKPIIIK